MGKQPAFKLDYLEVTLKRFRAGNEKVKGMKNLDFFNPTGLL